MTQNTLNDGNISDRLQFLGMDQAAKASLQQIQPVVLRELGPALDRFYSILKKVPSVSAFFADETQMQRAKASQIAHWSNISSGNFDTNFLSKVLTIGKTHARIGLEPRWYIGGYALILDTLLQNAIKAIWPKGGLMQRKGLSGEDAGKAIGNLVKGAMLDIDIVISIYLANAKQAEEKEREEAINAERELVRNAIGQAMQALASKDLTYRIDGKLPEAYGALRSDFNAAIDQLEDVMSTVLGNSHSMHKGTQEISVASEDLSKRAEAQAANLEQTAAAVAQITGSVDETAKGAAAAQASADAAQKEATDSAEIVKKATLTMAEIDKSSQQITQIINMIDEIALQTNLLALNAGVEAARAGDSGKGFAVVAQEVRTLAQRSAEAARDIKQLIASARQQVESGVVLVKETGEALKRIFERVHDVNDLVGEITTNTIKQAKTLKEINTAVSQVDKATQQNAAMAEQANAATRTLAAQSTELNEMVETFTIGNRWHAA